MRSEWETIKLSDIVHFNPVEPLLKGTLTKKIGMADLVEYRRRIPTYEQTLYTSGTRFRNSDTLFARITPCLENGKIAQVDVLEDGEVGFGSTEFIVWRAIEGISDPDFLFYLANYKPIVDAAIKSMVGSSGRQRVQLDVLKDYVYPSPPLPSQKAIARTLSCLDEKIEVNNKINANLEKQAKTIFKSWFVDFEPFQDGEFVESELGLIPTGFRVVKLKDVANIVYGKQLPTRNLKESGYPVFGGNGIIGYYEEFSYCRPQLLIACRGAASGKVIISKPNSFVTNNSLVLELVDYSLYEYFKQYFLYYNFYSYATGSAQPQITIKSIEDILVLVPESSVLGDVLSIFKSFSEKIYCCTIENEILANIRDTLLPKLMSGEIEVPVE